MIPPMMSPTNINKQLSGTTEGNLFHPCPRHPHRAPPSFLTLSTCLTYFGQGCKHDPECDFKGDLNVLIIQREECVLCGSIALGFLSSPADILWDHVLQQRHRWGALQGPNPGGLEDGGKQ
ncbi:hypothetical protein N326_11160, partial [Eurypyga helias]